MIRITRRSVLRNLGTGLLVLSPRLLSGSKRTIAAGSSVTVDVAIYGATPAGMIAALAAAREGTSVTVIEPTAHLGGIYSNGLSVTDSTTPVTVGGLSAQFFLDLNTFYEGLPQLPMYVWEPHAAESVFNTYAQRANITVLTQVQVQSVSMSGATIQSATLSDGTVITASEWIDASYEGDLMQLAGATYTVGRESSTQYNESFAGWGLKLVVPMTPYQAPGQLLTGINASPAETAGEADGKIMAYTFRSCLTTAPSNSAAVKMPPSYSASRYAALANYIALKGFTDLSQIVTMTPTLNQKFCLLSTGYFSTDYVGGGWGYPEGNLAQRAAIVQDHFNYVSGWLYFVANDPSIPATIRSEMSTYGLPLDEFADNGNWPWQMYVREGRRLVGQYVMTQSDVRTNTTKPDAIALGNWLIDSHVCDVVPGPSGTNIVIDGFLDTPANTNGFYEIPFGSLLPLPSEVSNLAVTFCCSASHIANASIRVEPTLMMLGEAAGVAAGIAANSGSALSTVDPGMLRQKLLGYGAVLSLSLRLGWPNANAIAIRGWGSLITWAFSDDAGPTVSISLFNGPAFVSIIAASVPIGTNEKGSYAWVPSSSLAYGTYYKITITSDSDSTKQSTSNGTFTIQPGSLRMVSPHGTENWIRNSRNIIQWAYSANPGPTVKIDLIDSTDVTVTTPIATGVPIGSSGLGTYTWDVQTANPQVANGSSYRIRVTSEVNPNVVTWSSLCFSVVVGTLRMTSPNGGEVWTRGTTQSVTWAYGGSISGNVTIMLLLNHYVVATIAQSTAHGSGGAGSCSWVIPTSLPASSEYLVKIIGPPGINSDASDKLFSLE